MIKYLPINTIKYLPIKELQKLNTKRLLTLYKSVRHKYWELPSDCIQLKEYLEIIKTLLNKREHIEKK